MIIREVMTLHNLIKEKKNKRFLGSMPAYRTCIFMFFIVAVIGISNQQVQAAQIWNDIDIQDSFLVSEMDYDTDFADSDDSTAGALTYQNATTGYQAVVQDDAGLVSEAQAKQLLSEMEPITAYGNVAFKTIDYNMSSTSRYAETWLHETFGYGVSATVFLIDMDNRYIYIFSDGAIYKTITTSYADTITDNVYRYASASDYYTCASVAFEQINMLLKGQKINQPMKYISNVLLGIILAIIINYFLVRLFSASKRPSGKEVMQGIFVRQDMKNFYAEFERETRKYSPQSSGGGGSGGGGGGGGGGDGGGGHSF